MKRVKSLVELQKYIAQFIDGDKQGLSFNGKELFTDASGKLFWKDKELLTEVHFESLSGIVSDLSYVENIGFEKSTGILPEKIGSQIFKR